jgi:hypothetical protein
MSWSSLLVARGLEPSDKIVRPLVPGHRCWFSRLEPSFEAAGSVSRLMPIAILARDALTKAGRTGLARSAPGDPLTSPGLDLSSKIRVPAATVLFPAGGRHAGPGAGNVLVVAVWVVVA